MNNLIKHGWTSENLLKTSDEDLKELIRWVRFPNRKVLYIKRSWKILQDEYKGVVPSNSKSIHGFPGIGPVSSLMMSQFVFNKVEGIPADSHIIRVADCLGWSDSNGKADLCRKQLESWLPRERWGLLYSLLLGYGIGTWTPKNPKCETCPVREFCPSKGYYKAKMEERKRMSN